ncbi:MAG: transcriptional regulator [Acidimicrobiales bacterium]
MHAQPRLRIAVTLATLGRGDRMTFPRLQELVGMSPGNLSTHLRKLEDAGYVAVEKAFRRRTPVTWLSITRTGRCALEDYTGAVRRLLATTTPAPVARPPVAPPPDHHPPHEEAP